VKQRIDELATRAMTQAQETGPRYAITVSITDAVNEALELAAKECEAGAITDMRTDDCMAYDLWEAKNEAIKERAAAIRKLKV